MMAQLPHSHPLLCCQWRHRHHFSSWGGFCTKVRKKQALYTLYFNHAEDNRGKRDRKSAKSTTIRKNLQVGWLFKNVILYTEPLNGQFLDPTTCSFFRFEPGLKLRNMQISGEFWESEWERECVCVSVHTCTCMLCKCMCAGRWMCVCTCMHVGCVHACVFL